MALTIVDSAVDNSSITLVFSDPVDRSSTKGSTSATNPANYTIFDPLSAAYRTPTNPALGTGGITVDKDDVTVKIALKPNVFNDGDSVLVIVNGIGEASNPGTPALLGSPVALASQVPGTGPTARITRDVEDAIAYPILTEDVGGMPTRMPGGTPGVAPAAGAAPIGQVVMKAVSDVLGWKANAADPKGFMGALTQSFALSDVEGHVEAKWTPRTYAVQTDLGGGITGAQASLYSRAKDALDKCLPLLGGLYPLSPEADPEFVKALREMARSQMTEIVKEIGALGGPSVLRVNTYFDILLGQKIPTPIPTPPPTIQFDPDLVQGTLGQLRDTYGIFFKANPFSNSVEDEQDITNFRVISDYMTSLLQSWLANVQFFALDPGSPAFFGTQLVLISRQLSVIDESVDEVRFALDSVFIGQSERQTLLLQFSDGSPSMFLEDILTEIENLASEEGPRLLQDGGRIALSNNILPVVATLQNLVAQAHLPANIDQLPDGFRTSRVRNALDDLSDQLTALSELALQVGQDVPTPEEQPAQPLAIDAISPPLAKGGGIVVVSIAGTGFQPGAQAQFSGGAMVAGTSFLSSKLLVATLDLGKATTGPIDVTVTNPTRAVRIPGRFKKRRKPSSLPGQALTKSGGFTVS